MQPDLVIKALLAGTVDLANSGTHFGMIAATRGGELKIIGGSTYGYRLSKSSASRSSKLLPI